MLAKVPVPEPRFSISTLGVEEEHIYLTTMDGGECVGRMYFTNTGKQRFERWEGGRRYTKLSHQFVSLWRPLNAIAWPFELPLATATLTKETERRVPAPKHVQGGETEDDPSNRTDIHLGRPGEAPLSVDEVEIRLLRAMRTRAVLERSPLLLETLWPKPFQDASKAIAESLRAVLRHHGQIAMPGWGKNDYDDYHVDGSELDARPVRFKPTPRDVSDYEAKTDLDWLSLIYRRDRHIFYCRAELPPVQWWVIADVDRVDEAKIKERYRDALERVFTRAGA